MLKNYINYIKDNPEGYWFKRKMYGWGWTPVKWQGWVVILGFVFFVMAQEILFDFTAKSTTDIWLFLANTFLAVVALILICKITGEKPKWQWGIPSDKEKK